MLREPPPPPLDVFLFFFVFPFTSPLDLRGVPVLGQRRPVPLSSRRRRTSCMTRPVSFVFSPHTFSQRIVSSLHLLPSPLDHRPWRGPSVFLVLTVQPDFLAFPIWTVLPRSIQYLLFYNLSSKRFPSFFHDRGYVAFRPPLSLTLLGRHIFDFSVISAVLYLTAQLYLSLFDHDCGFVFFPLLDSHFVHTQTPLFPVPPPKPRSPLTALMR